MANLGRAIACVEFYDKIASVNSNPAWQQFDIMGKNLMEMTLTSQEMLPQNVDFIAEEGWSVMMPSWIKSQFDNMLKDGEETVTTNASINKPIPRVEWSAKNIRENLKGNLFWNGYLTLDKNSKLCTVDPTWSTVSKPKPQDKKKDGSTTATTTFVTPSTVLRVEQSTNSPGIWWGAETNFKVKSMPFIVEISPAERMANKNGGLLNFILIRINKGSPSSSGSGGAGANDNESCIDILLKNGKVYVADWNQTDYYDDAFKPVSKENSSQTGPSIVETSLSYDMGANTNISIGIMPCMGRLVIYSGDENYFIYKRVGLLSTNSGSTGNSSQNSSASDETGILPFVLQTDTVGVYASNCSATICISAMEFLEAKCKPQIYGAAASNSSKQDQSWGILDPDHGTSRSGSTGSSSNLVTDTGDGSDARYYYFKGKNADMDVGVSCDKWNGQGMESTTGQENYFNPGYGTIKVNFSEKSSIKEENTVMTIEMLPSQPLASNGGDVYVTSDTAGASGGSSSGEASFFNSGAPFIYRLKGAYDGSDSTNSNGDSLLLTTYNVMSLSQKFDAQDIYYASQSVDLTLYYDNSLRKSSGGVDLEKNSYFVKVYFQWFDVGEEVTTLSTPFFTGVTMDVSISEVAGKETINLHCEDFMRILQDNYLLNSPFYDGLYWFDCIDDMSRYAGIINIINDASSENPQYFLPSGYTFQEPRFKFPPSQTIKDCMSDIVKLCERVFYFDENGTMHCDYLQGGLAYNGTGVAVDENMKFYRDPSKSDKNIILDEKKTEKMIGSVVNQIFVTSLDRATSQPIIVSHVAQASMPWDSSYETLESQGLSVNPPYKKILFFEQFAFGNEIAVQEFVSTLAQRVYKTPSRISIKTMTDSVIRPLTFFCVDGLKYRVSSSSMSFNAEDNSIVSNITGDWLGDTKSQSGC